MSVATVEPRPTVRETAAFDRASRVFEWPIAALALAIVPVLIIEETATDPFWLRMAAIGNWIIWLAFCVEYSTKLALAPDRGAFARRAWFQLAVIVLAPPFLVPGWMESLRGARALRLLRFLRAAGVVTVGFRRLRSALRHRRFHWVAAVALMTVFGGAVAEYYAERSGGGVRSFADSLWWAVVTATTVGYGDISPVTTTGRLIAVALMLVGIGVIGVFTATIASWFVEQERAPEATERARLEDRLEAIEEKLDRLLRQRDG